MIVGDKTGPVSNHEVIYCDYPEIVKIVRPKETITIDDGKVPLQVLEVQEEGILCLIKENCVLHGRRNIKIAGGTALDAMPTLTRQDETDLITLAVD